MRGNFYKLILSFCLLFLAVDGFSQILENYNNKIQELYPQRKARSYSAINIEIDLQSFPKSSFRLSFPKESTMFLDERLWFYAAQDTTLIVPSSVIENILEGKSEGEVVLSIIKKGIDPEAVSVQKGFFEKVMERAGVDKLDSQLPEKREKSNFNDFFFFALLTILFLLAIYKMIYPLVLKLIIMPSAVFSAEDFSESNSLQKFFTLDVIFYLLIVNMLAFLLGMMSIKVLDSENLIGIVNGDLNQLFLNWLFGSGFLILLAVLKFVFLRIMAYFFELGKIVNAHFFYLFRIISISTFSIAFIVSFVLLNDLFELELTIKYLLYGFFWIYLIGVAILFIIMSNRLSFKNYHLFVYICSAEIVPFLILTKVIIG
ncbi:DUF4271 domain-containing protein [Aquiflexum lacus]|uniref:DUF4271 domain-containing protein n=1 Tax=Aquiflexum lacus TaxID=2483805 RepID=UPI001895EFFA|nr:DUF4271 domain-containing protein [Aquiflexum lacus]